MAGTEKGSTPRNNTNIQTKSVSNTDGTHDTSVEMSVPPKNLISTDDTLEMSLYISSAGGNETSSDHSVHKYRDICSS